MTDIQHIYETIECNGFADSTLHLIDNYINDIQNGRTDFPLFTQPEHAGLCTAGAPLLGASIVASYATASLGTSGDASGGEGIRPNRWQIDRLQEQLIEQWAKAAQLWVEDSEQIIVRNYGPMIAQGAEAKVYYREGDTSVVKERASIYSTTQKALDAIALHNFLFPETAMRVVGFTRDTDGILRIILTQPYIRCLRLAVSTFCSRGCKFARHCLMNLQVCYSQSIRRCLTNFQPYGQRRQSIFRP